MYICDIKNTFVRRSLIIFLCIQIYLIHIIVRVAQSIIKSSKEYFKAIQYTWEGKD